MGPRFPSPLGLIFRVTSANDNNFRDLDLAKELQFGPMSLKCGQRLRCLGIVKEMPKVVYWVYKLQKPELGATEEVATAGRITTATYEHNYVHSEK